MKKLISITLALILCLGLMCGCTDNKDGDCKAADIESAMNDIITECELENAMQIAPSRLLDLYGIATEDIESSACRVTMDGVFPDEIIMITAVDGAAAERIAEKLEARLYEVKVQSQSYDPENYAMAQECKVITRGNTVALFLSAKHEVMERIFGDAPMLPADK